MEKIRKPSWMNTSNIQFLIEKSKENTINYDCDKCNDRGYTFGENNDVIFCKCREIKLAREKFEKSGISDRLEDNSFKNYEINHPTREYAKKICAKFIGEFNFKNSIYLGGQMGAGKSHLAIALSGKLLEKNNSVLYCSYTSEIVDMANNIKDSEYYFKNLKRLRDVDILFIDDLFKNINKKNFNSDNELKVAYDIINYRYDNKKPMIITSELTTDKLLMLDEGLGSRIIELCKNKETNNSYIVDFIGKELNYRLINSNLKLVAK